MVATAYQKVISNMTQERIQGCIFFKYNRDFFENECKIVIFDLQNRDLFQAKQDFFSSWERGDKYFLKESWYLKDSPFNPLI